MPEKKLSALGEFAWLRRLLPSLYWPSSRYPQLCIGPGDDAGVLRITPGHVLVASTDAMVEGVHFEPRWFSYEDLGYKALAINLSDLAAMGRVRPLAALVTAGFPGDSPVDNVDKFYKGLEQCARQWKTGLLGGDTVGSKKGWFISITVLGEARPNHLLTRQGARPGDWLVAGGSLGLAAAGLEILQSKARHEPWMRPLISAFCRPQPRFRPAADLAAQATSLMDCSDGLEASVRLLAETSGVGIEVDLDRLPVHAALKKWAARQKKNPLAYARRGGEEYELLFTVPPARWKKIAHRFRGAACIGRIVTRSEGIYGVQNHRRLPLVHEGFSHFNII